MKCTERATSPSEWYIQRYGNMCQASKWGFCIPPDDDLVYFEETDTKFFQVSQ